MYTFGAIMELQLKKFYFEPQSNDTYQIKTDVTDGTSALEVDSGKVALGTNIKTIQRQKSKWYIFL